MIHQPDTRRMIWRRRCLIFAIAAVMLTLFSVPIGLVLFGAVGASIGGLAILGTFILLQFPTFYLLKRCGILPSGKRMGRADN